MATSEPTPTPPADASGPVAPASSAEARLSVDGIQMVRLLGPQDRLLTTLERQYPLVDVHVRGNEISLTGDATQVAAARALLEELLQMVRNGQDIGPAEVASSARMMRSDLGLSPSDVLSQAILTARGKSIRPKTLGQSQYVDAMDYNTIVFGMGTGGRGKT